MKIKTKPMHTPGPWTYAAELPGVNDIFEINTSRNSPVIRRNGKGEAVADAFGEENARLIAAAPDLLAVVRALVGATRTVEADGESAASVMMSYWLIREARKAINKAEGK